MLSVAARAACVRFAAGASVVTAAHETDAAHCEALRRKMTPIGAFSLLSETPAAPSIPAVLLTFKAPLAAADLRDALTAGVAPASARFRSRVDERALEFVDDLGPAAAPFVVERGARGEAALPGAVAEALTAPPAYPVSAVTEAFARPSVFCSNSTIACISELSQRRAPKSSRQLKIIWKSL